MMIKNIALQVFNGIEADVNAYLFSDDKGMVLVDCLRNSKEAKDLVNFLQQQSKPLNYLLITHGHPDHYLGMNVVKQAFPDVQIVVACDAVKNDIIGFSTWMETVGWLDGEPAMKMKSATNAAGFDYEKNIGVLDGEKLVLEEGAELILKCDYLPAECEHLTTVYSEDLNAFLSNDFCYSGVHPWLAIDKKNIENWKNQLDLFIKDWLDKKPMVYPGHGQPGAITMFQVMKKYIEDFEATVASSSSRAEAMQTMQDLYPDYTQADFLLMYSVNAFVAE